MGTGAEILDREESEYESSMVESPIRLALASLTAGGCASGYGEVYVADEPPAAIVEVEGVAPGPDFVWIGGFHRWDGHHYVWNAGRWERPPCANASWEAGRWEHTPRGWHWTDGRWN
jgi:hypothetical protein